MNIWRISEYASLNGRGGELYEGRWNYQGDAIVYCCEHAALSMLEILVNADPSLLPSSYQLLTIHVPDGVSREAATLPEGWHQDRDETRAHWRSFWQQNRAALLRVPSVIMPHAYNWLINPKHPDHTKLEITEARVHPLDPRFRL